MSLDQGLTPPSIGVPVVLAAQPYSVQGPVSVGDDVAQWPGQNLDGTFIVSSSNPYSTTSNLASTENVIDASGPGPIYHAQGLIDPCMQNHVQGLENIWGQPVGAPSAAPSAAPGPAFHSASSIFHDIQLEQQERVFYPQFSTNLSEPIDYSIQTDPPLMGTGYFSLAAHQDPFWPNIIGCEPDTRAPDYQLQPCGIQSSSDQSEMILPSVDLQHEGLMIPAGSVTDIAENGGACPPNGHTTGTFTWPNFPEAECFIPGSFPGAQCWN